MPVTVTPLGPAIGAEITGLSGPALVDRAVADEALATLDDDDLVAFSDGTTDEVPARATLLTARQVSQDRTGDTEFANTCAAYDALPEEEKRALEGVRVVHSFAASQLLVYSDPSPGEPG